MITARLLNQDATFNNYKQVGGIPFVNGDTIKVVIQLYNEELGVRHIPSVSAVGDVKLGVNLADANSVDLDMTVIPEDHSIWTVEITTSNVSSSSLVGGNITFTMTGDANSVGNVKKGIIFNALQRLIIS